MRRPQPGDVYRIAKSKVWATDSRRYDIGTTVTLMCEADDGRWRVIDQFGLGMWDVELLVKDGVLVLISATQRGRPPRAVRG
jgi:hypothetical protein